jgi:hypothetical protein
MEESCWTFIEDTEEVCDLDWNCYTVEEALRVFFEGEWEYEVPDSDYFHRWVENQNIYSFFPFQHQDEEGLWACDDLDEEYRWCVHHNEETNEVCDNEGYCQPYDVFLYDNIGSDWMYNEWMENDEWISWDQTGV